MREHVAEALRHLPAHPSARLALGGCLDGVFLSANSKQKERRPDKAESVDEDRHRSGQPADQETRESRTCNLRARTADFEFRVSLDQLTTLDQGWKIRLVCDVEEHGERPDQEANDVELADRQSVEAVSDRDRGEQRSPAYVGDDEDRAPRQSVDPHSGRQADQEKGHELDDTERRDLERARIEDDDRRQRKRETADLRPEATDGFGRPELDEVRMPPEAAGRPEPHERSLSSAVVVRAGARSIRTSPETVFANSSTSGLSLAPRSAGASERSSSETVEPLTVLASTKTREPRRTPTLMSPETARRSIRPLKTASRRWSPEIVLAVMESPASRVGKE